MGVDYDGVGGIGVEVDDEIIDACIKNGVFTKEDYDDDADCLSNLDLTYGTAGSYYSGNVTHYLFVDGATFSDIKKNIGGFIDKLKSIGVEKTEDDIKVISEMLVS